MRKAASNETKVRMGLGPILVAKLSPAEFLSAFPFEMETLDMWAAAEPSIGSVVQLATGQYIHVIYGKATGNLLIHAPADDDVALTLKRIFREAPIEAAIWWRQDKGLLKAQE